jgi:hypothetical protein
MMNAIRAQTRDAYNGVLSMDKRFQYFHEYIMPKVRHIAQIFPPPVLGVCLLNTYISWFIWKGGTFRVLLSTIQLKKAVGGWRLINVEAKCLELFLSRMRI